MHRSQLAQAALDRFDASLDFGKIHVQPVGFPHVQAGGLAPRLLLPAKLGAEELIQRLLLPFRSESQWLAALQVAHHRHKLLLLPQGRSRPPPGESRWMGYTEERIKHH